MPAIPTHIIFLLLFLFGLGLSTDKEIKMQTSVVDLILNDPKTQELAVLPSRYYPYQVRLNGKFDRAPTVGLAIADFREFDSRDNLVLSVALIQVVVQKFTLKLRVQGRVGLVKISFVALDQPSLADYGLFYWSPQKDQSSLDIQTRGLTSFKSTPPQTIESEGGRKVVMEVRAQSVILQSQISGVAIFVTSLIISEGRQRGLVQASLTDSVVVVQMALDGQPQMDNFFLLVVDQRDNTILIKTYHLGVGYEDYHPYVEELAKTNQWVFAGITQLQLKQPHLALQELTDSQQQAFQLERITYSLIEVMRNRTRQSRRLVTTCANGYVWTNWDWSVLATFEDSSLFVPSSTYDCYMCPTGCNSCQDFPTTGSCYNANCLTCTSQFTLKLYVKTGCPDRYYCECKNNFPQLFQTNCRSCISMITGCSQCVATQWAATWCASCLPGYFLKTGVDMPRTCGACSAFCASCVNETYCTACSTTFTLSNNACICNTTQSLYYNPTTLTCTTCSSVFSNCISCQTTNFVTTCLACNTAGYYLSSTTGTCLPCSPYCTTCTQLICSACVSNTFYISGTSCLCDATQFLFLDTSTSPVSCKECSLLIPNCVNCSYSGSLSCIEPLPGYYISGPTSLLPCSSHCINCTSALNCFNCTTTFITNGTGCQCDTGANYLLNLADTKCVLCSLLIPNCQLCLRNTTTIYCQTCNNPYYNATVDTTICLACPLECASCVDPTNCTSCIIGFNQTTAGVCSCIDCSACGNLTANCAACTVTQCLFCMPGYLYNSTNNSCVACPIGCASCLNSSVCTSCLTPFVLIGSSCQCNNAVGQYYNSTNQNCSQCSDLFSNCTSCSGTTYFTTCIQCVTGYYLSNSSCLLCPVNSTSCTSPTNQLLCLPTFIKVNGLCSCDTNFLNTTSYTCTTCAAFYPQCTTCINTNLTATGVGCVACITGYYVTAGYDCAICVPPCVTCTAVTCIDCLATYSIVGTTCACSIANQLFEAGGFCQACSVFITNCQTCTGTGPSAVTCTLCVTGTYLSAPTECDLCGTNCQICDATGCLNCTVGFGVINGTCIFSGSCTNLTGMDVNCIACESVLVYSAVNAAYINDYVCRACMAGYYLVGNYDCLSCSPFCQSCTSYLSCTICQPTFTLINGQCECPAVNNQVYVVEHNSCVACGSLISGCMTCNDTKQPVECLGCEQGFLLDFGNCTQCPYGCLTCFTNGSCDSCAAGFSLQLSNLTCLSTSNCTSTQYFVPTNSTCLPCPVTCLTCLSSSQCVQCKTTFVLVSGACVCAQAEGYFYSAENQLCNLCGSFNSPLYGVYTANCHTCFVGTSPSTSGFECQICSPGFYLVAGRCYPCQSGCSNCASNTSCYFCQSPIYILVTGLCACNHRNNYFYNGTACQLCTIANCNSCFNLTQCKICDTGYFLNSSLDCQQQTCGDALIHGSETCDDGNALDGDGCSSNCNVEIYYTCVNTTAQGGSLCSMDSGRFSMWLQDQHYDCNTIQFVFETSSAESLASCSFTDFLTSSSLRAKLSTISFDSQKKQLTYTYVLNMTIQGDPVVFQFKPNKLLCLSYAYNLQAFSISSQVNPTGNQAAVYYSGTNCSHQQEAERLVDFIEYASDAVLILSALPCKIVGLQLFGVLQLAFLSLGSLQEMNLMQAPLKKLKSTNGFSLDLGNDKAPRRLTSQPLTNSSSRLLQTFTPERISAIDYRANFVRNCNVMMLVVLAVIVVASFLYLLTCLCKQCAPCLHRVAKRALKEVQLTLLLFNALNFAYTAGIHFRYAPSEDELFGAGTAAAVGALLLPLAMAAGLMCSEEEGFGEFKQKFKKGWLQKGYFVVTIAYRMGIGLYLSSKNEEDLSTLIVLALSLMFLLYNLVNLPFLKAYHNYRANICHLTQFVILFVAMYYRSMMSTNDMTITAFIFTPVYIEYSCIVLALVVSAVVLIYEIYLFVKECCTPAASSSSEDDIQPLQRTISRDDNLEGSIMKVRNAESPLRIQPMKNETMDSFVGVEAIEMCNNFEPSEQLYADLE